MIVAACQQLLCMLQPDLQRLDASLLLPDHVIELVYLIVQESITSFQVGQASLKVYRGHRFTCLKSVLTKSVSDSIIPPYPVHCAATGRA